MLINPVTSGISPLTIQLLLEELVEVDDWYTLGVALGVPVSQLKGIRESNPHDGRDRWKIEMFQLWLNSKPAASWADIIRAVEQLGHLSLAASLKSKYMSELTQQSSSGSGGNFSCML